MDMNRIFDNSKVLLRAIMLTGVILTSFFLGMVTAALLHMPDRLISGVWCSIAAVVVFDDLLENAKVLLKDRLLGTFTGALITAIFASIFHSMTLAIVPGLLLSCMIIIYFEWQGALKIACITVLIIGISSVQGVNGGIWSAAVMRFLESALGGMVAIGATLLLKQIRDFSVRLSSLQRYRAYLRFRRWRWMANGR